jgi:Cys-tRNA(Pro)/Cys-tRNA(Cys) deacylase
MAKTRGIDYLQKNSIEFEVLEYDFKIKGAQYASYALNVDNACMIKSIVIRDNSNNFYFALLGGNKELNLKEIAKILNVKKVFLADVEEAERITGYLVGGISPFGSKKYLPVIIDEDLKNFEYVYINGGARGVILKIKFSDLIKILKPLFFKNI